MKDWDPAFVNLLLETASYREFIKLFFHRDKAVLRPKKLTFGEFAQRSNFASKAYLNDIIAGRKRLTPGAFDKVTTGLRLNVLWAKYLKCLVGSEEVKFQSPEKNQAYFQAQRLKVKSQILRSRSVQTIPENRSEAQRIFLRTDFPEIYASLGSVGSGESLDRIAKKSRVSPERLKAALAELEAIGLVQYDGANQKYVPLSLSVETYGLKGMDFFKSDFFRSLDKAKQRFPKQAPTENALFMTQSFSVKSSQLAALRRQLAEIIETFSVQAEDAEGNCIAEICVGLTHNQ